MCAHPCLFILFYFILFFDGAGGGTQALHTPGERSAT
jgi:hypothetical protein